MLEIQSRVHETMVEFNELSSFSPHPDPAKLPRVFELCAYGMDFPVEQMMEMTGPELARHVSAQRPTTRVLFMTGYTEHDPAGAEALLHKPFSSSTLLGHVRRLLDSGSLKT